MSQNFQFPIWLSRSSLQLARKLYIEGLTNIELFLPSTTSIEQMRLMSSMLGHHTYRQTIVETLHHCRWGSEVLHASRWGHVKVVAGDHIDFDLPFSTDHVAIGHHWQHYWIGRTTTHVYVQMLGIVLSAQNWQTFSNCSSYHEGISGTLAILVWLGKWKFFKVCTESI